MIKFTCSSCGTIYSVPDDMAGKSGKCPKCQCRFTVPASNVISPANPFADLASDAPKKRKPLEEDSDDEDRVRRSRRERTDDDDARPRKKRARRDDDDEEEEFDYAVGFETVRQRQPGKKFPYECPGCGITIPIRERVALSKRKCPACGEAITLKRVDRQVWLRRLDHLPSCMKAIVVAITVLSSGIAAVVVLLDRW